MTKLIFAVVLIVALGAFLQVTNINEFLGPINDYVLKPISIIVNPIVEIFKIIMSFNEIGIVLSIFCGCSLIVYVYHKVVD